MQFRLEVFNGGESESTCRYIPRGVHVTTLLIFFPLASSKKKRVRGAGRKEKQPESFRRATKLP
jgi:hypothetical protein